MGTPSYMAGRGAPGREVGLSGRKEVGPSGPWCADPGSPGRLSMRPQRRRDWGSWRGKLSDVYLVHRQIKVETDKEATRRGREFTQTSTGKT